MDEDTYVYLELLNLVSPIIRKGKTVMRMAITPCEQLWTGLRFLATEKNCEDFKF
jgi:hypothetical protein